MKLNDLTQKQRTVLDKLAEGDYTTEQITIHTGLSGNTVRPRLLELEDMGLVEQLDWQRATLAGRKAFVWGVTMRALNLYDFAASE